MNDYRDIVGVTLRYCDAIDRRAWDLLRTCFVSSALVTVRPWGLENRGYDEIEAHIRLRVEQLDGTHHVCTNHQVEIDGGRAAATSYVMARHWREGVEGGGTFTVGGRYSDTLTQDAAGWRIHHRCLDIMWIEGNEAVIAAPPTDV